MQMSLACKAPHLAYHRWPQRSYVTVRCTHVSPLLLKRSQRGRLAPPSAIREKEAQQALETATEESVGGSSYQTAADGAAAEAAEIWRWETSEDAVGAWAALLGTLALGAWSAAPTYAFADLPYFISLAYCTIYIGAHRSLNATQQHLNLKEGLLAPIAASAALFSCYLLLKYLPTLNIKAILDGYFWLLALIAVGGGLAGPARTIGGWLGLPSWQLNLPEGWAEDEHGRPLTRASLALTDMLCLGAGAWVASADLAAHHLDYTLSNLIACAIAADILQLVGLRSFRAAGVLLLGMLAYDSFWVFGSSQAVGENVMMQVATSDLVAGPTRLLFPRLPSSPVDVGSFPFSLLGLGDVAIPGLLAALAVRYDSSRVVDLPARAAVAIDAIYKAMSDLGESEPGASMRRMGDVARDAAHDAYEVQADMENEQRDRTLGASTSGSSSTLYPASPFVLAQGGRVYFKAMTTAYIAGLLLAFGANAVTGEGQPALVYIVPCMLGTLVFLGLKRREMWRLWRYTDTTPERPGKKEDAEQQQQAAEDKQQG